MFSLYQLIFQNEGVVQQDNLYGALNLKNEKLIFLFIYMVNGIGI